MDPLLKNRALRLLAPSILLLTAALSPVSGVAQEIAEGAEPAQAPARPSPFDIKAEFDKPFDEAHVRSLLLRVDEPGNSTVLFGGYYARGGTPELPLVRGMEILNEIAAKEPVGSLRYFYYLHLLLVGMKRTSRAQQLLDTYAIAFKVARQVQLANKSDLRISVPIGLILAEFTTSSYHSMIAVPGHERDWIAGIDPKFLQRLLGEAFEVYVDLPADNDPAQNFFSPKRRWALTWGLVEEYLGGDEVVKKVSAILERKPDADPYVLFVAASLLRRDLPRTQTLLERALVKLPEGDLESKSLLERTDAEIVIRCEAAYCSILRDQEKFDEAIAFQRKVIQHRGTGYLLLIYVYLKREERSAIPGIVEEMLRAPATDYEMQACASKLFNEIWRSDRKMFWESGERLYKALLAPNHVFKNPSDRLSISIEYLEQLRFAGSLTPVHLREIESLTWPKEEDYNLTDPHTKEVFAMVRAQVAELAKKRQELEKRPPAPTAVAQPEPDGDAEVAPVVSSTVPGMAFPPEKLRLLLTHIDEDRNDVLLENNYFARNGTPECPIHDGLAILNGIFEREPKGTSRWYMYLRFWTACYMREGSYRRALNDYEDGIRAASSWYKDGAPDPLTAYAFGELLDQFLNKFPKALQGTNGVPSREFSTTELQTILIGAFEAYTALPTTYSVEHPELSTKRSKLLPWYAVKDSMGGPMLRRAVLRILEEKPSDPYVRMAAGMLLLDNGDQQAREILEEALEKMPHPQDRASSPEEKADLKIYVYCDSFYTASLFNLKAWDTIIARQKKKIQDHGTGYFNLIQAFHESGQEVEAAAIVEKLEQENISQTELIGVARYLMYSTVRPGNTVLRDYSMRLYRRLLKPGTIPQPEVLLRTLTDLARGSRMVRDKNPEFVREVLQYLEINEKDFDLDNGTVRQSFNIIGSARKVLLGSMKTAGTPNIIPNFAPPLAEQPAVAGGGDKT